MFLIRMWSSRMALPSIAVRPEPSSNNHNKLRRPWVRQIITVDNQGVNMTLINEAIISLSSFWPLATLLIELRVGAAGHFPWWRGSSGFLGRLTTLGLMFSFSFVIWWNSCMATLALSPKACLYLYSATIQSTVDGEPKYYLIYVPPVAQSRTRET